MFRESETSFNGTYSNVEERTHRVCFPQVTLSGAVEGKAVWPKALKPVAWHRDADRVRMKLGLYHKKKEVADGEVEYKNISIKGPNGKLFSQVFAVEDMPKTVFASRKRAAITGPAGNKSPR